jgi:hypothetical protein
VFWVGAAAGWALVAWGIAGVVRHRVDTRPADLVRFVVGGIVIHDLIVVPLALVVTLVVARTVPVGPRRWAQAALVVAAPLTLFAYPLVRGYGRIPGNPTALPHDYATNLALVLLAVGAVVAVAAGAAARSRHRR